MKNNFIFKVFLITVISSIIAIISFLKFDLITVKKVIDDNKYNYNSIEMADELVSEQGIDGMIEKLDFSIVNSVVKITEGNEFKYKVYKNSRGSLEDLEVYTDEETLKFRERGNRKITKNSYKIEITIPKDKLVEVEYEGVNGMLSSSTALRNIEVDLTNGEINLSGEEAYDTDINMVNGTVDMKFDRYKGYANVEIITGSVEIMGQEKSNAIIPKNIKQNLGIENNYEQVDIGIVNGTVTIN